MIRHTAAGLLTRAPGFLHPVLTPLRRGLERSFHTDVVRWRAFIAETEHWSPEQLREWQLARLQTVLRLAYTEVPYYRRVFDQAGAAPEAIVSLDDLPTLPILDKAALQEDPEALVSSVVAKNERFYFTTGGSTGIPVGFFHDVSQRARETAFMTDQWARIGYRPGDPMVSVRGKVLPAGRRVHRNATQRELFVSSYHLTEADMPDMIKAIRRFRPRFVQAYPSSATILARHMLETSVPPIPGVEAILCGSENLYPWQRELIEEAFGCRVYSWYGQSECVCLAGECERSSQLHLFPQYGIVELLDPGGRSVTEPGMAGEVIATSLHARAQPFIRYRTMDVAVLGESACDSCSRPYPLLSRIDGRLQEFMLTRTGRVISMTAINMHSPVFDNIRQFRFAQSVPGDVVLRVVPKPGFDSVVDTERIVQELQPKLGDDMSLRLEAVEEIPRTRSGKYHFIDQDLPSPFEKPS